MLGSALSVEKHMLVIRGLIDGFFQVALFAALLLILAGTWW